MKNLSTDQVSKKSNFGFWQLLLSQNNIDRLNESLLASIEHGDIYTTNLLCTMGASPSFNSNRNLPLKTLSIEGKIVENYDPLIKAANFENENVAIELVKILVKFKVDVKKEYCYRIMEPIIDAYHIYLRINLFTANGIRSDS